MNKSDLVNQVIEHLEEREQSAPKKLVADVVDSTFDAMKTILKQDGRVEFRGFGTFIVKERPARPGRNPQTGAKITIAASKTVQFKPTPTLKEDLK